MYAIIYSKNNIYDQSNSLFIVNLYYRGFHKRFPNINYIIIFFLNKNY